MCTDTVGPRRSTPAVVAKRVCRPCWSALWTRLAAATTARSNASSWAGPAGHPLVEHDRAAAQPFGGVLAHLEIVRAGRRPPVDRARLVARDVLAQAVELARPEAHGLRQEVAAEDAVAELGHRQLERPRGDEDLVDAGDDVDRSGEAEQVGAQRHERADRQHATPLGRHPVAGALLVGRRASATPPSGPCDRRRPPRSARSSGARRRRGAARRGRRGRRRRRSAPPVAPSGARRRAAGAGARRGRRRRTRTISAGGEHVQLEHAEDAAEHGGGDGAGDDDPALARRTCHRRLPARRLRSGRGARRRRPGSRRRRRRDRGGRRGRRAASGGG